MRNATALRQRSLGERAYHHAGANILNVSNIIRWEGFKLRNVTLALNLAILMALIACSDTSTGPEAMAPGTAPAATQTSAPTESPVPTDEPTESPDTMPPETPGGSQTNEPTIVPTSTLIPKDDTQAGVLSPLVLGDPGQQDRREAADSELSETELACLQESGGPLLELRWSSILSGSGTEEERVRIIGCLEDETVARIFLADIAEGVGPLSLETSTCVWAVFQEIDPRSMLLAEVEGYPGDALASATVARLAAMACLSEEEWRTADWSLREESGLREWMRCMMARLGGPGETAAAMTRGEGVDQTALAEAAAGCAEVKGPALDEEPGAPTTTPGSGSTSEPSSIAPLDPDDSVDLLSRLSQHERDCITDVELLADFLSKQHHVEYEDVAPEIRCLGDETLLDLDLGNLAWYFQELGGELGADTASCIQDSLKGISHSVLIDQAHTAKPSVVRQVHHAFWDLTVFYCLSEEEAALAVPDSGITVYEYDAMICTVDAFGGLEGLNEAYRSTDPEEFTERFLTAASRCPGG